MSYICNFCSSRPENCACSSDLTEPRLESELAVADNIMAAANPIVQRPYGLLDAPSPADFFSLLVEMESESKYDTPPSTPKCVIKLPPPPKLVRQTNRLLEQDLTDVAEELFTLIPDAEFSELEIQPCQSSCDFEPTEVRSDADQLAREAYEFARELGTYEYYRFARDFPDELIKCPTCEEFIYKDDQKGMCNSCYMAEQRLYPDDISMDLRFRDSF